MYESKDKMVSHPDHYQGKNGMEVIDVIEAFTANLQGIEAVCTANAIKYICRWKNKNGIQDLEKAIWYIQHIIDRLKSEQPVKYEDFELKEPMIFYTPEEVYEQFKRLYPQLMSDKTKWFTLPDEVNTIRVWVNGEDGDAVDFFYKNDDHFYCTEVDD